MQSKLEKAEEERSQLREMLNLKNVIQAITQVVSCLQIKAKDKKETTSKNNQLTREIEFVEKAFLGKCRPLQLCCGADGFLDLSCFASIVKIPAILKLTISA